MVFIPIIDHGVPRLVINTRKVHIKSFNLATEITPAQK